MIKAILISKEHRVYTGKFLESNSLQELTSDLRSKGFDVRGPIGVNPPYFILLLENAIPNEDECTNTRNKEWVSLVEVISHNEEIYKTYCELMLAGYDPPKRKFDIFSFGAGAAMGARLGHLVAKGRKRGTAGWLRAYEMSGMITPVVGLISLVTDGYGLPICFIETVKIDKVPFKEITEEMAITEGEGDLSLTEWKRMHLDYYNSVDSKLFNIEFNEEEIICFETFKVIKILGKCSE